jgi:hypothetical protein
MHAHRVSPSQNLNPSLACHRPGSEPAPRLAADHAAAPQPRGSCEGCYRRRGCRPNCLLHHSYLTQPRAGYGVPFCWPQNKQSNGAGWGATRRTPSRTTCTQVRDLRQALRDDARVTPIVPAAPRVRQERRPARAHPAAGVARLHPSGLDGAQVTPIVPAAHGSKYACILGLLSQNLKICRRACRRSRSVL